MNATSIIFLHGFPFNGSAWKPQVEYFKDRFEVYAPDLRGHGTAAAPSGPWMIAHYVEDLKHFMDEKKVPKAILCGLSMGGYIALQFVAKYPERVAGLILADTRADADSNEVKMKRYETIEKIHREGLSGFAKDFSRAVLSESTLRERPDIQKHVEAMILGNAAGNMAMAVGALVARHDNRSTLSSIRCPTAVFVGTEDKITPPELSELIAGGVEDSVLRLIEKAGHLSNVEQPDVFNHHIDTFLKNNFADLENAVEETTA